MHRWSRAVLRILLFMGAPSFALTLRAQEGRVPSRYYQAVVDGLLSTRHAMRADLVLRAEPGVLMSRTDHHTRNLLMELADGTDPGVARINELLAPLHLGVRCLRPMDGSRPFTPVDPRACEVPPVVHARGGGEDWEFCEDPSWWWPVEFGSEAFIATIAFDEFCCWFWDQNCQDIYDTYVPPGGNCEAEIPPHVDMNSQAFATAIATDPFCCTYLWDAWCDDLYEWATPPLGCDAYTLTVTTGSVSGISWNFVGGNTLVGSGGAGTTASLCILNGCFTMQMMSPDEANGWGGATWTLTNASNNVVASGGLATGLQGTAIVPLGYTMEYCTTPPDPGDPGGPGPGSPTTPPPASASDCPGAIPVCTNLSFQITPNGWGEAYEIPSLGSLSNPNLPFQTNPWGGSNYGCLRNRERNSTWMIVNIWEGGSLEFTFGGLGTQVGFYDWAMYPYNASTCGNVIGSTIAPVRCNWNGVSWGGTGLGMPSGGHYSNYEPPLNVLAGQQYLIYFSNWSHVSTSVPLIFGGTAVVDCRDVTLPVELVDFRARAGQGGIRLEWTTASETNTSHFIVERSADTRTWGTLAELPAAGHSAIPLGYAWIDHAPLPDINYYRLRMVDTDATYAYSPVAAVQQAVQPRCWPNPNNGSFHVEGVPPGATVEVIDALGRIGHVGTANEQGVLLVVMPRVSPGIHLLRTTYQGRQDIQRISILPPVPLNP